MALKADCAPRIRDPVIPADRFIIVPITNKANILALCSTNELGGESLELPGGVLDNMYSIQDLVESQLLKILGYQLDSLVKMDIIYSPTLFGSWSGCYLFAATGCRKVNNSLNDKSFEILELSSQQWIEACLSKKVDPISIVATFKSLPKLGFRLI